MNKSNMTGRASERTCRRGEASNSVGKDRVGDDANEALVASCAQFLEEQHGGYKVNVVLERVCANTHR